MASIDFTRPGCWLGDSAWVFDSLLVHAAECTRQNSQSPAVDAAILDLLNTRDNVEDLIASGEPSPGYLGAQIDIARRLTYYIEQATKPTGLLWPHLSTSTRSRLLMEAVTDSTTDTATN